MTAYSATWRLRCGAWAKFRAANLHLQRSAHNQLTTALRNGRTTRQSCVICGKSPSEGHHEDYARPLEVIWLCRWHHAQRHQNELVLEKEPA